MVSSSLDSFPFSTHWASSVPSLRLTSPGTSAGCRQKGRPVAMVRASDHAAPLRAAYFKVYPPPLVGSTQLSRALPSAATAQLGWMLPATAGFGTAIGFSACANPHADKASRRMEEEIFIGTPPDSTNRRTDQRASSTLNTPLVHPKPTSLVRYPYRTSR